MTTKPYILFQRNATLLSIMNKNTITIKSKLQQLIDSIGDKYAPDRRVEVFSVEAIESDKGIQLKGETTSKEAYKELAAQIKEIAPRVENNIRILPDEAIGEKCWGVVYNSVASLHSQPTHKSDIVSQLLLGMPVKVLDKSEDWLRIQAAEGYIGWVSGSIERMNRKELQARLEKPTIIVTCQYAKSYSKADIYSQSVSDIVIGNIFTLNDKEDNFYKVIYPDGRVAFIEKENAQEVNNWLSGEELTGESIVNTAKQLMGVPYVWGGTSSKGLDCSGFTKIVYWLQGIIIPRDASQQVLCGVEIDSKGDFDTMQKGDLVFFGTKASDENPQERVVHVGIYIGNKQFIHAHDYIRISSFNPEDKLFDQFNTNRYLRTMCYIGYEGVAGITPILEHPFYNKISPTDDE